MSTPRCTCETTVGIIELDLKDCINVDSISVQFSESLFKNKLIEKKYKLEPQKNCSQNQELSISQKTQKRCFEDALFDLNDCIKKNPVDFDCLFKRGVLLMHKGDYENAQYDFVLSLISQNVDYDEELKEFITSETFKNYKSRVEDLVKEKKVDELLSFVDNFERLGNVNSCMFRIEYCEKKLNHK
jgi:hypothetical protein